MRTEPSVHRRALSELPPELLCTAGRLADGTAERRRARSWTQLCDDLGSLSERLEQDLLGVTQEETRLPSLCAGWDVRDIVLHLVVGDDLALRSLRGEDCFASPTHDAERLQEESRARVQAVADTEFETAVEQFHRGRDRLLDYLSGLSPAAQRQRISWVSKPISRFALAQSRVMETWIHGRDLRHPLNVPTELDDRAWWVADIGVRHVSHSLLTAGVALGAIKLNVRLHGPAGGSWTRRVEAGDGAIGTPPLTISVAGPAWAWVVAASRRSPGRDTALEALTAVPSDTGAVLLAAARAFA